jgi:hypothetical protein
MSDPIVTVATVEILRLAFSEFVKTSASEVAKKLTSEALTKSGELRQKIVNWFQNKGDKKAKNAIATIQEYGSLDALNELTTYLDNEMVKEPSFAQDLHQTVRQIISIQSQVSPNRQYGGNYGRDQFIIESIQGNPNIGGS